MALMNLQIYYRLKKNYLLEKCGETINQKFCRWKSNQIDVAKDVKGLAWTDEADIYNIRMRQLAYFEGIYQNSLTVTLDDQKYKDRVNPPKHEMLFEVIWNLQTIYLKKICYWNSNHTT